MRTRPPSLLSRNETAGRGLTPSLRGPKPAKPRLRIQGSVDHSQSVAELSHSSIRTSRRLLQRNWDSSSYLDPRSLLRGAVFWAATLQAVEPRARNGTPDRILA